MNIKTVVILCLTIFIGSTCVFGQAVIKGQLPSLNIKGEQLGKLCVSQAYPTITKGVERSSKKEVKTQDVVPKVEKKEEPKKNAKIDEKVDNSKPEVIIYHTHSTESYQPYDKGNFHRTKYKGTVRELGRIMKDELNKRGVSVVHNENIHDRPSYNQSYDRSMETITALMKKYPSAKYIIDLHRDAAAYSGNVGKTINIKGEKVAKFSMVIGKGNANFNQLTNYANKVNNKAEAMYPGFGGRIINKEYRFNEYISDRCMLLEVGNNQNDIKEVRRTSKYFCQVLASVIEEEKK
ncbi:MAG: stage II sporulation protein P [Anaerovoracaceae bacterium]